MKKEARHATLYRAYRPATFDEVRGQSQVTDVLEKSIKNKKRLRTPISLREVVARARPPSRAFLPARLVYQKRSVRDRCGVQPRHRRHPALA